MTDNDRGALEEEVEQVFDDAWEQANKETGTTDRADSSEADDPANITEPPAEVVTEPPAEVVTEPPGEVVTEPPGEVVTEPPGEVVTEPSITETTTEPPALPQSDELDDLSDLSEEEKRRYESFKETLKGIHRKDKEAWELERAALLNDLEEAKKPPEVIPPSTQKEKDFVDSLTDEQREQLEEYEQDFDVVSKMEGIKRNVELGKLRKEIEDWKAEIAAQLTAQSTQFTSQLAPAVAWAEENERDTHFSLIQEGYDLEDGTHIPGHEDFEKYRDDGSLLSWIESKPPYLQSALKETYSHGSATDVIDLYTDFKRDNNITTSPDNIAPVNTAKTARKQALTAVPTRRGAVNPSMAVADDFESAWDEANSKGG